MMERATRIGYAGVWCPTANSAILEDCTKCRVLFFLSLFLSLSPFMYDIKRDPIGLL